MSELQDNPTGPIDILPGVETGAIDIVEFDSLVYPEPIRASSVYQPEWNPRPASRRFSERQEIILGGAASGAAAFVVLLTITAIVVALR